MNKNLSLDIAEFLGWHLGDGCISVNRRYSEYALTGDISEEYPFYKEIIIPTFNKIFKKSLNKTIKLKKYQSVGVCGLYIFDKNFVKILQKKYKLPSGKKTNIEVPKLLKTNEQKKCFLRGLFDTDGSIYFCKSNVKTKKMSYPRIFHYKPKIKIAVISKILIKQVFEILKSIGFSPRLYSPRKQRENENIIYPLVLDINKDIQKWINEIGFRNKKHLTKIQLWKKFGFCPPKTTLKERNNMLKGNLNPLIFYPEYNNLPLKKIKSILPKYHNV